MLVQEIIGQLQTEQRNRIAFLKSRIMIQNRLTANVAQCMGYKATDDEEERAKNWKSANELIKEISDGEQEDHQLYGLIFHAQQGIEGFAITVKMLEKKMVKLAAELPVAPWIKAPEQRGFGLASLAIILGETGDLSLYSNPAKVWKRMGCAPFTSRGKTQMGATWKSGKSGALSSEEWTEFGYSPRRRSIAYVMGENLVKQNQSGPYRIRYDVVKLRAVESHPDWKLLRAHRHAMLLCVKLLLKNLWCTWNGRSSDSPCDAETPTAAAP